MNESLMRSHVFFRLQLGELVVICMKITISIFHRLKVEGAQLPRHLKT